MKLSILALALSVGIPAVASAEVITIYRDRSAAEQRFARIVNDPDGRESEVLSSREGSQVSVWQRGNNHSAGIRQSGTGNKLTVFQIGRGASATIHQSGENRTGLLFQIGR